MSPIAPLALEAREGAADDIAWLASATGFTVNPMPTQSYRPEIAETVLGLLRAAVEAAVEEATIAHRRFAEEEGAICAKAPSDDGLTLIEVAGQQHAVLASATCAVVEKPRQGFGADLIALFEHDLAQVSP